MAIYVPVRLERGANTPVTERAVVFGFHEGRVEKLIMGDDMKIFIDDKRFQLFRGVSDTFIFLERCLHPLVTLERQHQSTATYAGNRDRTRPAARSPAVLFPPLRMQNISSIAVRNPVWFSHDLVGYMDRIRRESLLGARQLRYNAFHFSGSINIPEPIKQSITKLINQSNNEAINRNSQPIIQTSKQAHNQSINRRMTATINQPRTNESEGIALPPLMGINHERKNECVSRSFITWYDFC